MTPRFRRVALIGKYQASGARSQAGSGDDVMEGIGAFLEAQGCEVVVEATHVDATEKTRYAALTVDEIGERCDLGCR
jgi:NAD+ kinase